MSSRRLAVVAAIAINVLLVCAIGLSGTTASAQQPPPAGKAGPLTPRLQGLTGGPGGPPSQTLSPEFVPATSGPGSIVQRPGGRILVEIRLSDTGASTLAAITAAGANVLNLNSSTKRGTAEIAPSSLAALAAVQPQVLSVEEVLVPMHNATCPTGASVSEGDAMLNANLARANHFVDGSGIKVGVISDSYNRYAGAPTDVTNGELPGTTNPCGYTHPVVVQSDFVTGANDEARAMAQIVHDVAPGADIRVATADIGEQDFANRIVAMAAAGAKVIVDDITYFDEPMYQDGVVGKAVEDVVAAGTTYFSSAGNENTIIGGNNVASYETLAYRPTDCPATVLTWYAVNVPVGPIPLTCHNFNSGGGPADATYGLTTAGNFAYVVGWNEPRSGITTDLDFLILSHATGAVLGQSVEGNLVTQRAFEGLFGTATGTFDFVVVRYAGSTPRFKFLSFRTGLSSVEYPVGTGGDVVGPSTYGHNASRSGATVGAIPYNNANTLETYSSRGPATYCSGPVVGVIAAAPLSPCQIATVDMSATDGVSVNAVNAPFFAATRFFGTSAAAPHAAAIAALILQDRACLTPAAVLAIMKSTAIPFGGFNVDAIGAGRLDANAALVAGNGCSTAATMAALIASINASGANPITKLQLIAKLNAAQNYTTFPGGLGKPAACLYLGQVRATFLADPSLAPYIGGPTGWIAQIDAIRGAIPCP